MRCIFFCISKWHIWNSEVWWKNHCINHILLYCFVYVYTVAVAIIQRGANIPSYIAMGWPIQEVNGFYILNHTGSMVSNFISFTANNRAIYCLKKLVVEAWRTEHIYSDFDLCIIWYHRFRVHLVSDLHKTNTK